jgi:hypothetical protein
MIHFQKSTLPNSLAYSFCPNPDYVDQVSISIRTNHKIAFSDILLITLFNNSGWIQFLFWLRNILVKPFGLGAAIAPSVVEFQKIKKNLKVGDSVSFFEVVAINETEIVMGGVDKHLKGYLSLKIISKDGQTTVIACTIVRFLNFLGKAYFFFIQPFHVLIMKSKMKKIYRNLLIC